MVTFFLKKTRVHFSVNGNNMQSICGFFLSEQVYFLVSFTRPYMCKQRITYWHGRWNWQAEFKSQMSLLYSLSYKFTWKGHESISSAPVYWLNSKVDCDLQPWVATTLGPQNSESKKRREGNGKAFHRHSQEAKEIHQ